MQAVLSGRAAVALVHDRDSWHSVHYGEPESFKSETAESFELLFRNARDLVWLNDVDVESVRGRLEDVVDETEALDAVLILLNDQFSPETHEAAALELEELLAYPEIVESIENVILSEPFGKNVNVAQAIAACRRANCPLGEKLIREWHELQPGVVEVFNSWRAIDTAAFSLIERDKAHGHLIRQGEFRRFVRAFKQGDHSGVQMELSAELRSVSGLVGILNAWTSPLRSLTIDWSKIEELKDQDVTEEATVDGRRQSIDRPAVLDKVESQKQLIVKCMHPYNVARVDQLVKQLIQFQLTHGGKEFVCKTLCDLAFHAQEHSLFQLQLQLTEYSISIVEDDAWSWTQNGKALQNLNRLDASLAAYDRAREFASENVAAKTGRAEVLKSLGKLDQALDAYTTVVDEHPENVVAKTGRAEVLKSLEKLDQALDAYTTVVDEHPEDVVAKTGREEVLNSLGKLDQLGAYTYVNNILKVRSLELVWRLS